jgi:hypothetical protein
MMILQIIRNESLRRTAELGYSINENLPLLDQPDMQRGKDEIVDRTLALFGAVAHSYGFPAQAVKSWLQSENLTESLSPSEKKFLDSSPKDQHARFQGYVEALWALAWILEINPSLDFEAVCSNNFIHLFPNLKTGESGKAFRDRAALMPPDKIIEKADLAYCLHWGVMNTKVSGKQQSGKVPQHVIVNRRKALDWVIGSDAWDEVPLDT